MLDYLFLAVAAIGCILGALLLALVYGVFIVGGALWLAQGVGELLTGLFT